MATTFAWVWDVPGRKGPVPVPVSSFSVSLYPQEVSSEPESWSWSKEKTKKWLQTVCKLQDEALMQRLLAIGGVKEWSFLPEEELAEMWPDKIGPRRSFMGHVSETYGKMKAVKTLTADFSLQFEGKAIPELTVAGHVVTKKRLARVTLICYASGDPRHNGNGDNEGFVPQPRGTPRLMMDMYDVLATSTSTGGRLNARVEANRLEFLERGPGKDEVAACFYDAVAISGGAIAEAKDFPVGLEFPGEALESDRMEKHMEMGGCSFAFTKANFKFHQASYECHTCWPAGANKCVCAGCRKCHEGHDIVEMGSNNMYCDCGSPAGECPVPCQGSPDKKLT
jgi:hypothetical protein